MLNDDHVADVYLGHISDATTQSRCRNRIDWMVANTGPGTVLDIGCSQGIVAIHCARAGANCSRLDRESMPIKYANHLREKEPPAVQARVQFGLSDVLQDDLPNHTFDTVLLGEILEHQSDPQRLLRVAVSLAGEGGRVVVTTPIGVHPHPDHRTTFDLRSFLAVTNGFALHHLSIEDLYIRCVLGHGAQEAGIATPTDRDLLDMSEDAMLQRQLEMADRITHFRTRCDKLVARTKQLQGRIDSLRDKKTKADDE